MKEFKHHPVYHTLQHYHTILTPHLLETNPKKKLWKKQTQENQAIQKCIATISRVTDFTSVSVQSVTFNTY